MNEVAEELLVPDGSGNFLLKNFFGEIKGFFEGSPLILIIFILVTMVVLVLVFFSGRWIQKLVDKKMISEERRDAVKRSRSVLGGQFSEQLAPYLPNFPCNPGDVRFVGKPVDYVAFPGRAQGEKVNEVLFIEVKTGESALSQREREIKEAVLNGRVRYVEYHINT